MMHAAFAELAELHALMSFQEPDSDISRLNRSAHSHPVQVDPRTFEVLSHAQNISRRSAGAFDITVAPWVEGVAQEFPSLKSADTHARWSDVQLLPDRCVAFARPLRIDVSGIAKGYAVDRALALLSRANPDQVCVNAGGDLSVRGAEIERVFLDNDVEGGAPVPAVDLRDGSLASSGFRLWRNRTQTASEVTHINGVTRRRSPLRFASVLASSCMVADALTKVVLAHGAQSAEILRNHSAWSILYDGGQWREVGRVV